MTLAARDHLSGFRTLGRDSTSCSHQPTFELGRGMPFWRCSSRVAVERRSAHASSASPNHGSNGDVARPCWRCSNRGSNLVRTCAGFLSLVVGLEWLGLEWPFEPRSYPRSNAGKKKRPRSRSNTLRTRAPRLGRVDAVAHHQFEQRSYPRSNAEKKGRPLARSNGSRTGALRPLRQRRRPGAGTPRCPRA